jgi:predicted enzyme related to lactoylglutathione lyase
MRFDRFDFTGDASVQRQRLVRTVVAAAVVLVIGCNSTDDASESTASVVADSSTTTVDVETTTTEAPPTTLDIVTVPADSAPGTVNPAATGTILMLKLFVDDLAAGEAFYGSVFGATVALEIGDGVHILSLPGGGPGLVLIEGGPDDDDKYGAFIMQVPDLEASLALALANGATMQGEFAGEPGSQPARSIDLLDPFGNQVEILQIG